jgi:small subunit ribosomal protein S1
MSWSQHLRNPQDFLSVGDELEAVVLTMDREDRKMSLGIKQLSEDPWTKGSLVDSYGIETRHKGIVRNLTNFGLFIELEEGIGGMIHISDLSWTKRFAHPAEFTKVGATLDVVILEIDQDNRKLSLGHKQLEENPWGTFASVFPVGSSHEATILRRDDKGAIVQLPYGLEAFAPIRHIKKEDGTLAEAEEQLVFKVIEFNRDDKRILVSHTRHYSDAKRDADMETKRAAKADKQKTKDALKDQQSKIEKSTLGDLNVFSQLREQLKDEDKDDA